MSLLQIMEGWKNHFVPAEELRDIIEVVQKERLSICKDCEFNSDNCRSNYVVATCVKCSCILNMKTACLSCKCPVSKWDVIDVSEKNLKPKEDEKI